MRGTRRSPLYLTLTISEWYHLEQIGNVLTVIRQLAEISEMLAQLTLRADIEKPWLLSTHLTEPIKTPSAWVSK